MAINIQLKDLSKQSDIKNLFLGKSSATSSSRYTACTVENKESETEFKYYHSSRTFYEDMLARSNLQQAKLSTSATRVSREVSEYKYYIADTAFVLYKNLFHINPSNERKTHVEINFIYEIPNIIYLLQNKVFNREQFMKQYSDLEYYVLIDLITCTILGVITESEELTLKELMFKDNSLKIFYKNASNKFKENRSQIRIETVFLNKVIHNTITPTSTADIMAEFFCQMLKPIAENIHSYIKSNSKLITFKSCHDFRYILLVEPGTDLDFRISVESSLSMNDTIIIPKVFRGYEALTSVMMLNS